ncbi:histidine phosphatase family protein [Patulibacter defluvii]|uniref:histidine phosphatase family protein n=1 Tax=Patulibacter defluvii TaxID=3095358 RepID=UPI002A74E4BC|nr:histidine phosphatase family protein [Patulibacter sp. DM4]
MPAILLVRHGQASFGLGDYDRLSDHGRAQARALGGDLRRRGLRIGSLTTGELRRQRETADELLSGYATAPGPVAGGDPPLRRVDGRWDEFDHEGLVARLPDLARRRAALVADTVRRRNPQEAFQTLLEAALTRWISGEDDDVQGSFLAFAAGARAALEAVAAAAADEQGTPVVVSSAGTISAVCAGLLGVDGDGWLALNRVLGNSGVTTIVSGRRGLSLISFNEQAHLEGPGRPHRTTR